MSLALDEWPLREPFVIAGSTTTAIVTLTVELREGDVRGRGEALGVDYRGETAESMCAQLEAWRRAIEGEAGRALLGTPLTLPRALAPQLLDELLPPGGARNALDCALWDLRVKRAGRDIWSCLGSDPRPVATAFTLSLDAPIAMAAAAQRAGDCPVLKLKLDATDPAARIAAVRATRPDAELLVDANGSWDASLLTSMMPALAEHRVALVEQPLPAGEDSVLAGWRPPVPLCADESCHTHADLERVAEGYQVVNVKLDKAGGLTEALRIVQRCEELGLALMVGNMLGSSLAMAPAFVVAQRCRWVDLDGPLLQARDRTPAIRYDGALLYPPAATLWG